MSVSNFIVSTALVLGCSLQTYAQEQGPTFENTIVPRQGRLFSVDYTPKGRLLKISLVGKPIKIFSPDKYSVTAESADKAGIAKNVMLLTSPEGYRFKDLPAEKTPIKIKVEDKTTKESEVFLLKP
ncbi:MAG: hypothetical protein ACKOX6_07675 [Bdellovibrio sp.]